MSDIVLDASALLAVLRSERGAEEVERRLEGASIGAVNLSEVVAKLSGDGAPEAEIRLAIAKLELDVRAFAEEQAYTTGLLRGSTRKLGLRSAIAPRATLECHGAHCRPVLAGELADQRHNQV